MLDIKSDEDYLSIDTLQQKDMKNEFNPPPENSIKDGEKDSFLESARTIGGKIGR